MAASELDAHYSVARRVAFQVEEQLQELETGRDTSLTFQGNISTNLNQLARELETLEALLTNEHDGARRGAWRKCVPLPRASRVRALRWDCSMRARGLTRAARAPRRRARPAARRKLKQLQDNSSGLRAALEKFATRSFRCVGTRLRARPRAAPRAAPAAC